MLMQERFGKFYHNFVPDLILILDNTPNNCENLQAKANLITCLGFLLSAVKNLNAFKDDVLEISHKFMTWLEPGYLNNDDP